METRRRYFCGAILAWILVLGCDSTADLRTERDLLYARLDSLSARIDSLAMEMRFAKMEDSWNRIAFLKPGTDGYAIVRTEIGNLTMSLEDVTPYANGSRVVLRVGNTTSAVLTGVKATVEWGSVDSTGVPSGTPHSKEVTLTETLAAGSWNNLRVVLDGLPPADLGYVRVRDITSRGMRLVAR